MEQPDGMVMVSWATLLNGVDAWNSRKCLYRCLRQESFTRQTIIPINTDTIAFDAIGDYVGGKVHHFSNEDHEFVKVSIPGKYLMQDKFAIGLDYVFQNSKDAMTPAKRAETWLG